MECIPQTMTHGRMGTHLVYNSEKIRRIREKIKVVFGSASTWDDETISKRYDIAPDGDLIMIAR